MWARGIQMEQSATFSIILSQSAIQQAHKESMVYHWFPDPRKMALGKGEGKGCSSHAHKAKTKRIFLVDDDHDHTITFKMGLELAGFEVDAYMIQQSALSRFRPDYYDLIPIDVKMRNIGGLELYEKIRKMDNKAVVWFITAYETDYRIIKRSLINLKRRNQSSSCR